MALLGFGESVADAVDADAPSKVCGYLFDLASTFTTFYERCPVLKADDDEVRRSRLLLADAHRPGAGAGAWSCSVSTHLTECRPATR